MLFGIWKWLNVSSLTLASLSLRTAVPYATDTRDMLFSQEGRHQLCYQDTLPCYIRLSESTIEQ